MLLVHLLALALDLLVVVVASRGALLGVAAARRGAARVLPKALLVFGLLPLVEGQELAVQEE
ncbi:MAG: hypothetical protein ACRC1U_09340 [Vibrionaceae bacterium]